MRKRFAVGIVMSMLVPIAFGTVLAGCAGARARHAAQPGAGGGASALGPGDYTRELTSGGRQRSYRVHVPPGYVRGKPVPLVLNFHPGGGNAAQQEKDSQIGVTADAHGFIVVHPNGTGLLRERFLSFNAGMCCGYAKDHKVDDVGFVRDMLDDIERTFSIDPKRVYATGYSNGAILSQRLGCELSERIAAIAPVAGPMGIDNCRPVRPVPVLYFHGTADPFAPYEGGLKKALVGSEMQQYKSARETIAGWVERDRCTGSPQVTLKKGAVTCQTWGRCADDADVTLCTIEGGGHTWPGGQTTMSERTLGPLNRDVSASEMIWQFFAKHSLP